MLDTTPCLSTRTIWKPAETSWENMLPVLSEPLYDPDAFEWYAEDTDGITYWGETAADVERAFRIAMTDLLNHSCKSGEPVGFIREARRQDQQAHEEHLDWLVEMSY